VLVIFVGLFNRSKINNSSAWLTLLILITSVSVAISQWPSFQPWSTPEGFLSGSFFSLAFKILIDTGGLLTVLMALRNNELKKRFNSEFFTLVLSATLGSHLLCMTSNFVMILISLELVSISTYVLAGYHFSKKGAEGSLKYFLFGSVASAVMLYGFSILYGMTGTIDFSSAEFDKNLLSIQSPLVLVAGLMALGGFLYKVAAVPMHPWAPDVYEAAPVPVVAFLSVVPKLAGMCVLAKFALTLLFSQSNFDWQFIVSMIAMLSIGVGNFSALWQNNPKRMMAYSSIAQTGFLLIAVICVSVQGIQFLLFYSAIYLLANFTVFYCLQAFEKNGVSEISSFSGWGRNQVMISVILLLGLVSLAGIPPTAGFTSKLFIFTALWTAYEQTGKDVLFWLLIFGLVNTVISLFYYLKIPYYSFLKTENTIEPVKKPLIENYLAFILVVLVLFLFIRPDILMGWLNRINFVL
jgi:NADH-quinone oxidoreductase subunit N